MYVCARERRKIYLFCNGRMITEVVLLHDLAAFNLSVSVKRGKKNVIMFSIRVPKSSWNWRSQASDLIISWEQRIYELCTLFHPLIVYKWADCIDRSSSGELAEKHLYLLGIETKYPLIIGFLYVQHQHLFCRNYFSWD